MAILSRTDLAVIACFAVTATAAIGVWQLQYYEPFAPTFERFVGDRGRDRLALAQRLAHDATGRDDAALWAMASEQAMRSPRLAGAAAMLLMDEYSGREQRRLGVYIAEQAGLQWQDGPLLVRAGFFYWRGRAVPQDYDKAIRYMSHPAVEKNAWAQLQLGRIYLDPNNPHRDAELARAALRRAADGGSQEALRLIEGIAKQP